jgi:hypothetical protein
MSRGQASRTTLPELGSMDEQRRWKEINRWADKLPLNLIGFVADGVSNSQVFADGVTTPLEWWKTRYESDQFFTYGNGTPADKAFIPAGMGGLYGFHVNLRNSTLFTLFGIFYVRVLPARSSTAFITNRTVIPDWFSGYSQNLSGIIPYVLSPGDRVEFLLNQTSGAARTLVANAAGAENPACPTFCFYRVGHADLT